MFSDQRCTYLILPTSFISRAKEAEQSAEQWHFRSKKVLEKQGKDKGLRTVMQHTPIILNRVGEIALIHYFQHKIMKIE